MNENLHCIPHLFIQRQNEELLDLILAEQFLVDAIQSLGPLEIHKFHPELTPKRACDILVRTNVHFNKDFTSSLA